MNFHSVVNNSISKKYISEIYKMINLKKTHIFLWYICDQYVHVERRLDDVAMSPICHNDPRRDILVERPFFLLNCVFVDYLHSSDVICHKIHYCYCWGKKIWIHLFNLLETRDFEDKLLTVICSWSTILSLMKKHFFKIF